MNFSTDSELLAYEPYVFTELPITAQTLVRVEDAAINGRDVTSATGGFNELEPGRVALVGEGAFPIASVTDDNTLTLTVAPIDVTDMTLIVRTFEPQRLLIHERLLATLDLEVGEEGQVLSMDLMRRAEAIGVLSRAYFAGFRVVGTNTALREKAERYQRELGRLLHGATVRLDTNGDGVADTLRRPGIGRLVRR